MSKKRTLIFMGVVFALFFIMVVSLSIQEHDKKVIMKAVTARIYPNSTVKRVIVRNRIIRNWEYDREEDKMTSDTINTAKLAANESITTGGHWEDQSSTTTFSNTTIKEKKPWYQSSKTSGRKKFSASTNTTTTSSSGQVWVADEGLMVLCLKSVAGKKTSVIFYSTTATLPVNYSTIRIRFDDQEPIRFNITPTAFYGNGTDGFTLNAPKDFLPLLKKTGKMLLEFGTENSEKKHVFTFRVEGLKWEH